MDGRITDEIPGRLTPLGYLALTVGASKEALVEAFKRKT